MRRVHADVRGAYRQAAGQTLAANGPGAPKERRADRPDPNYERHLRKRERGGFGDFNGLDLVYYFRDASKAAGCRYSVSNLVAEAACMKGLLEDYTAEEICGMVRFVFESGQDYMDKASCSPRLLAGNWRNSLYPDSQAWLAGEWAPKKSKHIGKREWGARKQATDIKIGEWEE